jgi:excisionase family DNA binding protein
VDEVDRPRRAAYTLREAAELWGIARDTAYRRAAAGDLPVRAWKIGTRWYVSKRALDALLGLDERDK